MWLSAWNWCRSIYRHGMWFSQSRNFNVHPAEAVWLGWNTIQIRRCAFKEDLKDDREADLTVPAFEDWPRPTNPKMRWHNQMAQKIKHIRLPKCIIIWVGSWRLQSFVEWDAMAGVRSHGDNSSRFWRNGLGKRISVGCRRWKYRTSARYRCKGILITVEEQELLRFTVNSCSKEINTIIERPENEQRFTTIDEML